MKKILLLLVLFLSSFFGLKAQTSPVESQAYINAKIYVISNGYTIVEDKYAYISQGNFLYSYRTFYTGLKYVVYAMSQDGDVKDVDVILYNSDGTEYTKDTSIDPNAAVDFIPYVDRYLKIVVRNYRSDTPNDRSLCRYFVAWKY